MFHKKTKTKTMKQLIRDLLLGKPVERDYPPLKGGFKTIKPTPTITFNEWAINIRKELTKQKT
jgi:hypothetical protein